MPASKSPPAVRSSLYSVIDGVRSDFTIGFLNARRATVDRIFSAHGDSCAAVFGVQTLSKVSEAEDGHCTDASPPCDETGRSLHEEANTTANVSNVAFALGGAAPQEGEPNPLANLVLMVIIFSIFYLVLILPMRTKQKKLDDLIKGLKAGDKVFAGTFGDAMTFKLGPGDLEKALAQSGVDAFEPMKGRPMKEWVLVPLTHAKRWPDLAERAFAYVRGR